METYYAKTLFELVKQTIPDGIHIYHCTTNDIEIEFQIINYNTDTILNSTTVTYGNTTVDTQMLILKFNKNLTINSGITLRPQVRKKGMLIYVEDTLTNNGTISMTQRGASAVGQNVYLYHNEYVPAVGGTGVTGMMKSGNGGDGSITLTKIYGASELTKQNVYNTIVNTLSNSPVVIYSLNDEETNIPNT